MGGLVPSPVDTPGAFCGVRTASAVAVTSGCGPPRATLTTTHGLSGGRLIGAPIEEGEDGKTGLRIHPDTVRRAGVVARSVGRLLRGGLRRRLDRDARRRRLRRVLPRGRLVP